MCNQPSGLDIQHPVHTWERLPGPKIPANAVPRRNVDKKQSMGVLSVIATYVITVSESYIVKRLSKMQNSSEI